MVIKEALLYGEKNLSNNLYTDPINESRKILSFLLSKDLSFIYIYPEYLLDEYTRDKFIEIIEKRKNGLPLEYIFHEKNFFGRDFFVDERVLIPRWDTENLVNEVIKLAKSIVSPKILEIGAGSGAISLTLGMEIRNSSVLGVDISNKALEVCEINKNIFNIENVSFIYSDLFSNVKGKYDIIVSNPPYIKTEELIALQREVTCEPINALDGGEDGLYYYKHIIKKSINHITDNGILAFEIGHDQGNRVKELLEENKFKNIEIKKDLQGLDRVIWGVKEGI
ncbi:MAG: peptide chain release factor N(5)-glutamine methyltransferase [Tissierellia bacterium]|nr:peptide chain release factor N(5)-glutamine methyltransferase [Tissierellia bacterium]